MESGNFFSIIFIVVVNLLQDAGITSHHRITVAVVCSFNVRNTQHDKRNAVSSGLSGCICWLVVFLQRTLQKTRIRTEACSAI